MYPVLITKVRRDIQNDDTSTELAQDREHSETLLAQVTFILNLIFMREMSHLYTIFSKNSQAFDVLPFHCMTQFEKLKTSLSNARDALKSGKSPDIEIINFHTTNKPFNLWEDFDNYKKLLLEEQTFFGFKVLLPAERGRVTRSLSTFASEMGDYSQLVKSCLSKYDDYIELVLFHLHCRFIPWPEWLVYSNSCFNFLYQTSNDERKISFEKLLDEKSGPAPLKDDEKKRLKAEYVILLVNVEAVKENSKLKTPEAVWYELLTEENNYKTCINVNEFALRFLTRVSSIVDLAYRNQLSSLKA